LQKQDANIYFDNRVAINFNTMSQSSSNRHLLIFGNEENRALVQQQLHLLDTSPNDVNERKLKITVVEKENSLYKKYNVKTAQFTVILIGKDGTEKHRTNTLLQMQELFTIIDAMPMRRAEMGKKN
jgi:hypothetical protein